MSNKITIDDTRFWHEISPEITLEEFMELINYGLEVRYVRLGITECPPNCSTESVGIFIELFKSFRSWPTMTEEEQIKKSSVSGIKFFVHASHNELMSLLRRGNV